MGVELRPVFRPTLAGVAYRAEGKALVDDLDALDDLAAQRGITPLSAFMESPGEDFGAGNASDWFAAADGLRTVNGLLEALADTSAQAGLSDWEAVANDLEELRRCLEAAVSRRAEFRLSIG